MPPENFGANETNYTPDSLFAGEFPIVTDGGVIASGQGQCVRGQVLGKITASGKYAKYDPDGEDGSEEPVAILAVDADATSQDVKTTLYLSGWFKGNKLIDFTDAIRGALRLLGIYVTGDPPIT
jgi:hypothetical protein